MYSRACLCRLLWSLALPLCLLLGALAPALAQTPVQGSNVNFTASDPMPAPRDFDPPYQGEVTLSGGGGKDIAGGYIDALLPFWRFNENSLLFVNPRFNFGKTWNAFDGDSGDMQSGSIGLGWRLHLPDPGLILGANVYYDHLWSAKNNKFEQIGAGLEVMHQWFDFRFNYYWPLNDREHYDTLHTQQVTSWSEDWSKQWRSSSSQYDGIVAQGHHVYERLSWSWADNRQDWRSTFTQTLSQTFDLYEVALEGFDVEIGLAVPLPEEWGELRLFGGYMYFDSDYTDKYDGLTARLEYRPVRAIAIDAQWLEEDVFLGSNWTAGVRLILPFDMGALAEGKNPFHNIGQWFSPGSRALDQRLTEMVKRDSYTHNALQAQERQQERSLTTTKEDVLLAQYVTARGGGTDLKPVLDPDGNPLFFYFVDPLRSTGSDGSYEDPFATPLDGLNALGSSGRAYEGLSLAAGQSYVDASGVTHLINLDNTPLNGVLITGNWQTFAQEYFGQAVTSTERAAWTTGQVNISGTGSGQLIMGHSLDLTASNTPLAVGQGLLHGELQDGDIIFRNVSATGSSHNGVYAQTNGAANNITMDNITAQNSAGQGIVANMAGGGAINLTNLNVQGAGASGVNAYVTQNGSINIDKVEVQDTGANAGYAEANRRGLRAIIAGAGNIELSNISQSNSGGTGIYAEAANGEITMTSLSSSQAGNHGVSAITRGVGNNITMSNITAEGSYGNGININAMQGGNVSLTEAQVSQAAAGGIYAAVQGNGRINIDGAKVEQTGSNTTLGESFRRGLNLTITGAGGIELSNISQSNSTGRGIYASAAEGNIVMDNLTSVQAGNNGITAIATKGDIYFRNGLAWNSAGHGLVLQANDGDITLSDSSFLNNAWHGAVLSLADSRQATVHNFTATGNNASNGNMGGLQVQSVQGLGVSANISLVLTGHNQIYDNTRNVTNADLSFYLGQFTVENQGTGRVDYVGLMSDGSNRSSLTFSPAVTQDYYDALGLAGFTTISPGSYSSGAPVTVETNHTGHIKPNLVWFNITAP